MSLLSRACTSVAMGAAGALYLTAMIRRNRRLVPPAVNDRDERPLADRRFTFSDDETVTFLDVGDGPPVLLLPGADGIKETFRYQIPELARRYRVIATDLRARFAPQDGFDRLVRDAVELLDGLEVDRAFVLGQSLGGAIAMRFAVRYPERVLGLVLANTLARVSYAHVGLNRTGLAPAAMATTRYLPTVLARLFARAWSRLEVWIFDRSPGGERVIEYALWTGPRPTPPSISQRRVSRLKGLDLRPELASIEAPTLVLKGPRDHYTPPAWSKEIAELIPGALYREVPETGHCCHISMSESFNRILLEWLDRVLDDRATDVREVQR
ncbi:MAG: alpha/beta fold hydrolase [Gemmatimonadota bacterium]